MRTLKSCPWYYFWISIKNDNIRKCRWPFAAAAAAADDIHNFGDGDTAATAGTDVNTNHVVIVDDDTDDVIEIVSEDDDFDAAVVLFLFFFQYSYYCLMHIG